MTDTALPPEPAIAEPVYARYMKAFALLRERLSVNLHVTQESNALAQGDIFLFNHFTRLETAIPPLLIYEASGCVTRSVAHYSLFKVPMLAKHLRQGGCVPSDMPGLLPFLAKEILRGRKVVIFPEGGLVRDKKVIHDGAFGIYSDKTGQLRKHHRGAAALGVTLEIAKHHLRTLIASGNAEAINRWCTHLRLTPAQLQKAVEKPTLLVPGTITFYPLRNGENALLRGAEKIFGEFPQKLMEDLVTESNIMFNPTDMYVHFSQPVRAMDDLGWGEKLLINQALTPIDSLEALFGYHETAPGISGRYYKHFVEKTMDSLRDEYARRLYQGIAVNFNHVAASVIGQLVAGGQTVVEKSRFHKLVYLALKNIQAEPGLNLHCTITRVSSYGELLSGQAKPLRGFLSACARARLVTVGPENYTFTAGAITPAPGQSVRIDNPIQLHVNEIAPVTKVAEVVSRTLKAAPKTTAMELSQLRFDDELRAYQGMRHKWAKKAPHSVFNPPPPHSGEPFFLLPKKRARTGVLLVHGFATLPSDMRGFAEYLHGQGYAVLGMRLPGHGTSPLDMENRLYTDWLAAVRTNHEILTPHVDETVLVGYSTGGMLGLLFSTEKPAKLAAVATVAAPVSVQDKNFHLLPLVMLIRKVLRFIPGMKDLLGSYMLGSPTKPEKYLTVPTFALNQLRQLINVGMSLLPTVSVPVLVLQGTADKTVKPESASLLFAKLGSTQKHLEWVEDAGHGLIVANEGATWNRLQTFLGKITDA